MIAYTPAQAGDVFARETLLDRAFGPGRFRKSSEKIRSGRLPSEGLALVARDDDRLVGSVRLWEAAADRTPLLLLGPLAVDDECRGAGIGAALMRLAIDRARTLGHGAVVLVGDEPYYRRFGFTQEAARDLRYPPPTNPDRLLARALIPGAFSGVSGLVSGWKRPAQEG